MSNAGATQGQTTPAQIQNQLLARMTVALEAMAGTLGLLPSLTLLADATLGNSDVAVFVDATAGAVVPTLPLASSFGAAKLYIIAKTDVSGNAVTITPSGPNTISGAATLALAVQYDYAILLSYAGGWMQLSA